ncbi:MAG: 3,4-dihydroxy-2-butanone-4-phosphate synthase [Proteobacteria bacterium]|nr:3,4-dihydroxy-2-butanone-4-phosphate synthase [Pseudomonadota bacterium]
MRENFHFASVEEIVEEVRNGRMIILVDDEKRENEGDLVMAAELVTPEAITFMATQGRGLICLPLTRERIQELKLEPQANRNESTFGTAFTVSIEAKEGVTTGISAPDRAQTIHVAIDPTKTTDDIRTPGHIFPLEARAGGVLARAGHTEAAVDLARLAGMTPAGVICEVMNDDGTMARLPQLIEFSERHGLKLGSIADLIAYRSRHDKTVRRVVEIELDSRFGGTFHCIVFKSDLDATEHFALIKGDITTEGPVLVRVHAINLLNDLIWDRFEGRDGEFQAALKMLAEEGRGVAVLIFEYDPYPAERLIARKSDPGGPSMELRRHGIGAQILQDLGIHEMILLTNSPRPIVALEGFGLSVVGHCPIVPLKKGDFES